MKAVILITTVALVTLAQAARDWSKIKPKPLHVIPRIPAVAPRIVGGEAAEPHGVAHQAAVISDDGSFCGGSIIRDDAILTAAHCVDGASSAVAILGAHKILEEESDRQIIKSKVIKVHENWDPYGISHDIAVIILLKKIIIDGYTTRILVLNTESPSLDGEYAAISGWGVDSDSSTSISPVLRYTVDKIISNEECQRYFGSIVTKNHLCVDGSNGRSSCTGDSGGPLVVGLFTPNIEDLRQAGIVSFLSAAGCEKGYPSGYTRVSEYKDWIAQQLAPVNNNF